MMTSAQHRVAHALSKMLRVSIFFTEAASSKRLSALTARVRCGSCGGLGWVDNFGCRYCLNGMRQFYLDATLDPYELKKICERYHISDLPVSQAKARTLANAEALVALDACQEIGLAAELFTFGPGFPVMLRVSANDEDVFVAPVLLLDVIEQAKRNG